MPSLQPSYLARERGAGDTPEWARWTPSEDFRLGMEEEVMILEPHAWQLSPQVDRILGELPVDLAPHITPETHAAAIELAGSPHRTVADVFSQATKLRRALHDTLARAGLRPAAAGTHPCERASASPAPASPRYQLVHGTMRELARREPTFALHVHVGVGDPERATQLLNRLRTHVPLLLALSANSPFWQGRDTGFASMRVPLFQAFPRAGLPRGFAAYADYVAAIESLLRAGAIPEPTFVWWDVRLQPRLGTVETRIMDAQSSADASAALAALVQAVARLELSEGFAQPALMAAAEVLDENRFLAARDGMQARLIDPEAGVLMPARRQLDRLLAAARPHAQDLGCEAALAEVAVLAREGGAARQRAIAAGVGLEGVAETLAEVFLPAY